MLLTLLAAINQVMNEVIVYDEIPLLDYVTFIGVALVRI